MCRAKLLCAAAAWLLLAAPPLRSAGTLEIEGAPTDTGFNVGTAAGVHATLKGVKGDPSRYAVFAEIQYIGTTSVASVELDRQGVLPDGDVVYEGGWPIPPDAPTGVYSVKLQVEDRKVRKVVASQELRGFAAYRRFVSITSVKLDKTFYTVGEPIQCEVAIQNLSGAPLNGLRVEFSNANFPWISNASTKTTPPRRPITPAIDLKVLKDNVAIPAHREITLPMTLAGTARLRQGEKTETPGAKGSAGHGQEPPPEMDQYVVAVWNAGHTVLYGMELTKPVMVRAPSNITPKPQSDFNKGVKNFDGLPRQETDCRIKEGRSTKVGTSEREMLRENSACESEIAWHVKNPAAKPLRRQAPLREQP